MRLRPPSDADWPAIHAVANEALPNAPDGNTGWLEARKALPSDQLRRRHYVIEDEGGMVAGYGGIEPAGPRGWFRLFVVIAPKRLDGGAGDLVLVRLLEDARDLGAIAFDLIPESEVLPTIEAAAWLLIGALVFVVADRIVESRFGEGGAAGPLGIVVGAVVDGVPESLIFGIQIAAGQG